MEYLCTFSVRNFAAERIDGALGGLDLLDVDIVFRERNLIVDANFNLSAACGRQVDYYLARLM